MGRSEVSTSVVKVLVTRCLSLLGYIYRSNEARCLFGCFVYHFFRIPLVLFCIILSAYGCMFCMLLFNYVNYVFLFLYIVIVMYFYCYIMYSFVNLGFLIVMYIPFCVFCFIVLFSVLLVCKCVLYYYHRMSTQLQLNISYRILTHQYL